MIATKNLIVNILLLLAISANASIFSKKKPLDCGDNSLVNYGKKGLPKRFPWSVYLMVQTAGGDSFCDGVIISPNHILGYNCPSFYLDSPVGIYFKRRKIIENILVNFEQWPSQTIKNPNWTHWDRFYVLTLNKPIIANKKHAPICISEYIPEENLPDPVYFGWVEKNSRDDKGWTWATSHFSSIQKKPIRPGAVSYLKGGKWYLAGMNLFKAHYPFKNIKSPSIIVDIYYPFNGTIPIVSNDQ